MSLNSADGWLELILEVRGFRNAADVGRPAFGRIFSPSFILPRYSQMAAVHHKNMTFYLFKNFLEADKVPMRWSKSISSACKLNERCRCCCGEEKVIHSEKEKRLFNFRSGLTFVGLTFSSRIIVTQMAAVCFHGYSVGRLAERGGIMMHMCQHVNRLQSESVSKYLFIFFFTVTSVDWCCWVLPSVTWSLVTPASFVFLAGN